MSDDDLRPVISSRDIRARQIQEELGCSWDYALQEERRRTTISPERSKELARLFNSAAAL